MTPFGRSGRRRRDALTVIAKEPVAGLAKTRLVPALGEAGAARAAAAMLTDTLAAVRAADAEPWLCFTPAEARERLGRLAPGFGLLAQAPGDLGDRLAACLADLLAAGADRVAIVGADTPQVPPASYRRAFALLDEADVVLGPALDGGYYLVAAKTAEPDLFVGITMGTEVVLSETLARAARAGLLVALLPPLRDLDRVEDLAAAVAAGELAGAPATHAAAADLLGAAMVDFAAGRRAPAWLRVAPGRRLAHNLAAYFAPVTAPERALLDLVEGPVLDVGCGPARHARFLQACGLTVIGLDRSSLALELARSLGLRHWLHADARSGPLPAVRTVLLLDGNLGLAGTPNGAVRLLHRLATACGPGGRLLVGGRAPRHGRLRPLVVRDEYQNLVGPWGRWLQAGLPAVLDLAHPAGWRLQHAITAGAHYWAALSLDAP
jgi:rSAM/selenodomain-associated transferase 1